MENSEKILRFLRITVIVNVILAVVKMVFAVMGHAAVLRADSVNSMVDILTTVFLIGNIYLSRHVYSRKEAEHRYKRSALIIMLIAMAAAMYALLDIYIAATSFGSAHHLPDLGTLIAAVVSLAVKFAMTIVSAVLARRYHSASIKRDTFDHAIDAATSVISVAAILLAVGTGLKSMDFIGLIAFDVILIIDLAIVVRYSADILLDRYRDTGLENRLHSVADEFDEVDDIRITDVDKIGESLYVSADVVLAEDLSPEKAEDVLNRLENYLEFESLLIRECDIRVARRQKYE